MDFQQVSSGGSEEGSRSNASGLDSDMSLLQEPRELPFDLWEDLREAGGVLPAHPAVNHNANNNDNNDDDESVLIIERISLSDHSMQSDDANGDYLHPEERENHPDDRVMEVEGNNDPHPLQMEVLVPQQASNEDERSNAEESIDSLATDHMLMEIQQVRDLHHQENQPSLDNVDGLANRDLAQANAPNNENDNSVIVMGQLQRHEDNQSVVILGTSNVSESQERIAFLRFARDNGMSRINCLDEFSTTVDVGGDGNCFFYAVIIGLYYIQHAPFYLNHESREQRHRNLFSNLRRITRFRIELFHFLQNNSILFCSPDANLRYVHNAVGNNLNDFSESSLVSIRKRLYKKGTKYSQGCSRDMWADLNQHLPIVALFHKTTVICYFTSDSCVSRAESNVMHHTTVAHYDSNGHVTMFFTDDGFYSPPKNIPSITLKFVNGNHFQYLRQKMSDHDAFHWGDIQRFMEDDDVDDEEEEDDDDNSDDDNSDDDNDDYNGDDDDDDDDEDGDDDGGDENVNDSNGSSSNHFARTPNQETSYRAPSPGMDQDQGSAYTDATLPDNVNLSLPSSIQWRKIMSPEDALKSVRDGSNGTRSASSVLGGKSSMSKYLHYEKELEVGDKRYIKYKELPKDNEFTVKVPSNEVCGKVIVQHDGSKVLHADISPDAKRVCTWFRQQIVNADNFPQHICLRCNNKRVVTIGKTGRGKRARHPYLVVFDGWCAGTKKRASNTNSMVCTTKWIGGIDADNLLELARNPFNSTIELKIRFTGSCCHDKNEIFGDLRGEERQKAINQVRYN